MPIKIYTRSGDYIFVTYTHDLYVLSDTRSPTRLAFDGDQRISDSAIMRIFGTTPADEFDRILALHRKLIGGEKSEISRFLVLGKPSAALPVSPEPSEPAEAVRPSKNWPRLRDIHGLFAYIGRAPIADQDIWFTQVSLTSTNPASVIILSTVSRGQ
jgi:hypothetical protein